MAGAMSNFSWDDLRHFLAVARTGQLSAAARELRTSHVTVSRRIDRLERMLGQRLFERSPKGYALTTAGGRLVEHPPRQHPPRGDPLGDNDSHPHPTR